MIKKEFNKIKPYCYYLKRKTDGLQYFGVRWKNTTRYKRTPLEDFCNHYFSSHSLLKKELKLNKNNFITKLVGTFDTIQQARLYESRFNKKIIKSNKWLNIQAFPQIIHTSDTKEKISKAHLGKIVSEVTKLKLKKSRLGKKASKKTRQKMSSSQKGDKNHFFGKKHSEENLKKMKGRKVNDEVKKRISEKLKGRKLSQDTVSKMIKSRKGYKHSLEVKKKLSKAKIGKLNPFFGKKLSSIHKKRISLGLKKRKILVS